MNKKFIVATAITAALSCAPMAAYADALSSDSEYSFMTEENLATLEDFRGVVTTDEGMSEAIAGLNLDFTNGDSVDLTDSGYKAVIVNFWEPWCGPCCGELAALENLYETYQDEGLLVVGVFSSDPEEYAADIQQLIDENGVTYPIAHISEDDSNVITLGVYPTTYFLDGNGNVIRGDYSDDVRNAILGQIAYLNDDIESASQYMSDDDIASMDEYFSSMSDEERQMEVNSLLNDLAVSEESSVMVGARDDEAWDEIAQNILSE